MIESILIGAICGAAAYIWCRVLTAPGMAAGFVPRLYWRVMGVPAEWKQQFAKPLFDCPVCNSFWLVLIFPCQMGGPRDWLAAIVAALLFSHLLDRHYEN